MLKIQKSYYKENYIVYDTKDFNKYHTHTRSLRIALIIRDNVRKNRIPKSRDKQTIISHIRVSRNPEYVELLNGILKEIEYNKNIKKRGENNGKVN